MTRDSIRRRRAAIVVTVVAVAAAAATAIFLVAPAGPPRLLLPIGGSADSESVRPALADLSWAAGRPNFSRPSRIEGFDVSVGVLGGSVTFRDTVDLVGLNPAVRIDGALPFVTSPSRGRVLYGYYDGVRSTVRLVSATDGTSGELLSSDAIVHRAVLDPSSQRFFVLLLDPRTRGELGIFRGSIGSDDLSLIVPPRETEEEEEEVHIRSQLFVSEDGTTLLSYDCRGHRCRLRGYDDSTGLLRFDVRAPAADVYGMTGSELLLSGGWLNEEEDVRDIAQELGVEACDEAPCPILGYNLQNGSARSFGAACSRAQVVDLAGASVVVSEVQDCHGPDYHLAALGFDGVFSGTYDFAGTEYQLVMNDGAQGVELPDGWFLLAPSGTLPLDTPGRLVRLRDGLVVTIPAAD